MTTRDETDALAASYKAQHAQMGLTKETTVTDTKQLPGGRLWTRKPFGRTSYAYESDCKTFDIAALPNGKFRLLSIIHVKPDGSEWFRDFPMVEEAMEYAEKM
jgi:hypothetical protein